MSRKLILATLFALPMGVAVASTALASGEGERKKDGAQIIQLLAKTVQQTTLDLGEQGISQGDRIVFHEELSRNGRRVGEDGGDCVVVRIEGPALKAQCSVSFSLSEGQITGQGLVTIGSATTNTLAVTGGTGRFLTAHGEMLVEEREPNVFRYTITLIH
jgi:Allene oxide cyclase barrel like domain